MTSARLPTGPFVTKGDVSISQAATAVSVILDTFLGSTTPFVTVSAFYISVIILWVEVSIAPLRSHDSEESNFKNTLRRCLFKLTLVVYLAPRD